MTRPPTPDIRPCPWPTCPKRTKPRHLMCPGHWYTLPADIRARINETYRPGQNALTASPAYRAALRDALDYARQASTPAADPAPDDDWDDEWDDADSAAYQDRLEARTPGPGVVAPELGS